MTRIIHTNQTSKKKTNNAKTRQLQADWEALVNKWKVKSPSATKTVTSKRSISPRVPDDRSHRHIPSCDSGLGTATVRPSHVYTGDKIIGIGQMHKSNAVPIFKREEAEDIARMRR